MNKKLETIVFFGSGPVAAKSLELLDDNFTIEAVITKPRPIHHKGEVPVLSVANKLNIPTHTATNKHELDVLINSLILSSRLAILIDFGIIVSKTGIDYFPLGIINSHFSLLPRWRGADPITFAILKGDSKTGVSLMLIDEGMDTGKIIAQKSLQLNDTTTNPELTNKLIELSNNLLQLNIPRYTRGSISPRSQPHPNRATYSNKLNKSDSIINWDKPSVVIDREIRAFLGWPGSRTLLFNKDVIITKACSGIQDGTTGKVRVSKETGAIIIYCKSGHLKIEKLKPSGKLEMTAPQFISGYYKKD